MSKVSINPERIVWTEWKLGLLTILKETEQKVSCGICVIMYKQVVYYCFNQAFVWHDF